LRSTAASAAGTPPASCPASRPLYPFHEEPSVDVRRPGRQLGLGTGETHQHPRPAVARHEGPDVGELGELSDAGLSGRPVHHLQQQILGDDGVLHLLDEGLSRLLVVQLVPWREAHRRFGVVDRLPKQAEQQSGARETSTTPMTSRRRPCNT
jgi:hypothetical protein